MTAWVAYRRLGLGAIALVLVVAGDARSAPGPEGLKPGRSVRGPSPAQLRAAAEAAEAAGDWEAAFAAYCHLYVTDRTAPDAREKLNNAVRRFQQARRHRDPAFRNFAESLTQTEALNLYVEVMELVPGAYGEPERSGVQQLWANGVEEFDRALGSSIFRQTFLEPTAPERVENFRLILRNSWAKRTVTTPAAARTALRQLIAAARDAFGVRVPGAVVIEFVCGACCGLDEYTVFLTPPTRATSDPAAARADLSAQGIYLAYQGGEVFVDGVAAGSWAALNTPLRKGQRITRINGRTMEMAGPAAAAAALRSSMTGTHELELAEPPAVVLLPVTVPTVYSYPLDRLPSPLLNPVNGIGYLKIGAFQASTAQELEIAIGNLRTAGARALVLDLRGNHGGSFLAGVEVARRFLPAGIIVTTQGQIGRANAVYSSDSAGNAIDLPLVVLIDAESASAAEVVAAAFKDNGRATLVGTQSFGKGAIQYPFKLATPDDPAGRPRAGTVRLTIARVMSPRGAVINGGGVVPHVVVVDPDLQLEIAIQKVIEAMPAGARPMPMPPASPVLVGPNLPN